MKPFRNLLAEIEEGYVPGTKDTLPEIKSINLEEYDESGQYVEEDFLEESANDPPMVILMRRQAIRTYPNGQKVALYYSQQFDKYLSIPYDDKHGIQRNIGTVSESFFDKLKECKTSRFIQFKDKSSAHIVVEDAKAVYDLSKTLDDEVRNELSQKLNESSQNWHDFLAVIKEEKNNK